MPTARRVLFFLLTLGFAVSCIPASAQQLIDTVTVGVSPVAVALNPATNKIYVANSGGASVTVIDGLTDSTTSVTVGFAPNSVAVNPVTNKVYVVNGASNTVTVIDGATLSTTTINVGVLPDAIAVNSVTNKIYVANEDTGTVTVIDGGTLATTVVPVGHNPLSVAVDSATNKVYVANYYDNSVTVIDGATNSTVTLPGIFNPIFIAGNALTNKIYVANFLASSVTVIDGSTNSTQVIPAGTKPIALAINPVSNKIYAVNNLSNDVTVIDGATNQTAGVPVGNGPFGVAVNEVSNKIYVVNSSDNTVTMIDGATNATTSVQVGTVPKSIAANAVSNRVYVGNSTSNNVSVIAGAASAALQFIPVTPPCRLVDTRTQNGGGGPIQGGTYQSFNLPQLAQAKGCASLAQASAFSLNVTLIPQNGTPVGYLSIWPTGEDQPLVSTMNSLDGRVKANAAIVPTGYQGNVSVYVTDTANVVLDIDGYFAPLPNPNALAFYPLTPCRVADTRQPNFPPGLGTPHLSAGVPRDFPVLSSTCIPVGVNAQAYSFNFTVVPYPALGQPLGYLEVWPKDQKPQGPVSTLNNTTGTIVANAALVPAGTNGEITGYANNDTEVVIDIDGYFAAPGAGGLSLYTTAPCRVLDTRKGSGAFMGKLTIPILGVAGDPCGLSSAAQGLVLNATVVPPGALGYLTLWPDGQSQPIVSTLNAYDGAITSNMAIVPTTNGSIDAFSSNLTQLILDINSYFAP